MYVIVGLGNPGKKYEQTRHNIGFITVDQLAEKHGIKINRIKHKALVGEGLIAGEKVIAKELEHIPNEKVRGIVIERLKEIADGQRDFRF